MERGERILEFDIGKSPSGHTVHCIATTEALYVAPGGANPFRIPYRQILDFSGGQTWIALRLSSGEDLRVDFGRGPRGLYAVVEEQCQAVARKVHVTWGGDGATFRIVAGETGEQIYGFYLDNGTQDGMTTGLMTMQANRELEASLGITQGTPSDPRPEWMPEFEWNPPLRTAGLDSAAQTSDNERRHE
jgi:hypothetical protein